MAKRRPAWFIPRAQEATPYAFFVSHVGEDAEEVRQLKTAIEEHSGRGGRTPLRCFLDVTNWPGGNENSVVIRGGLLRSEYMVAWVTTNYLRTQRGWVWLELALAQLIELSLNAEEFDIRRPYIVPVFRDVTVTDIERTPLLGYWQRKLVLPKPLIPLTEIAQKLVDFHEQQAPKSPGGKNAGPS